MKGPVTSRTPCRWGGDPAPHRPASPGRPSLARMVRCFWLSRSSAMVRSSSRRSADFRQRCGRQWQFTPADRRPGPAAGFERIGGRSAGHPAGWRFQATPATTGAVRSAGVHRWRPCPRRGYRASRAQDRARFPASGRVASAENATKRRRVSAGDAGNGSGQKARPGAGSRGSGGRSAGSAARARQCRFGRRV